MSFKLKLPLWIKTFSENFSYKEKNSLLIERKFLKFTSNSFSKNISVFRTSFLNFDIVSLFILLMSLLFFSNIRFLFSVNFIQFFKLFKLYILSKLNDRIKASTLLNNYLGSTLSSNSLPDKSHIFRRYILSSIFFSTLK